MRRSYPETPALRRFTHKNRASISLFLFAILLGAFDTDASLLQGKSAGHDKSSLSGKNIIDFSNNSKSQLRIVVDSRELTAGILVLKDVPKSIRLRTLGQHIVRPLPLNKHGELKVDLEESGINSEYSLLLLFADADCNSLRLPAVKISTLLEQCKQTKYTELIRQPASWLKSEFNFDREDGYTILGRRTFSVREGEPSKMNSLPFVGRPVITLPKGPSFNEVYQEVEVAKRVIRYLWSQENMSGPASIPYSEFLKHRFSEKLNMLGSGEFAVMCQGFRDLFLHASTGVPNLKARAVEAYNYAPQIDDLITYGHSTAEVWVEQLSKWVLVDPWVGIAIKNQKGELMSAAELVHSKSEDLAVIPLVEDIPRFYRKQDGSITVVHVNPKNVSMDNFSYTPVGHSPGFLIYFNHLIYRGFVISN